MRLFKGLREARGRTYLAVFLIFTTHAVIDALTIYGTRVFWPLDPDPVGVGSIFIIDPIYTLPLLGITLWALFRGTWSARFATWTSAALILTSAYLAWGLVAQSWVKDKAVALLAEHGIRPERVIASPTPFNSLFWKAIAIDGDRYINLYLPVFGGSEKATAYAHPRGTEHLICLAGSDDLARLAEFSQGFFSVELEEGAYIVSDLRMGMTPNYVFRFAIARETADGIDPIEPERRRSPRQAEGDLDWLTANLTGEPQLRQAEASAAIDLARLSTQVAKATPDGTQPRTCT